MTATFFFTLSGFVKEVLTVVFQSCVDFPSLKLEVQHLMELTVGKNLCLGRRDWLGSLTSPQGSLLWRGSM